MLLPFARPYWLDCGCGGLVLKKLHQAVEACSFGSILCFFKNSGAESLKGYDHTDVRSLAETKC